jgi:formate hydrogenlyase subunit 6/NADH:ubiquinone oxidoreductase subunit I
MGIPVQKFAQMREDFANHNSACIQCGICVEVCPMDVLSVVRADTSTRVEAKARKTLPIVMH